MLTLIWCGIPELILHAVFWFFCQIGRQQESRYLTSKWDIKHFVILVASRFFLLFVGNKGRES